MPKYSTSPDQVSPLAGQSESFVPFTAHIRVVPDVVTGKRLEYQRNLEKIALRVEEDLIAAGFNIATPVAFTPQFGDYSARLTVVGFAEQATGGTDVIPRGVKTPTTNINLIHSGTDPDEKTSVINGNRGGTLSEGQDTVSALNLEVIALRESLAAASDQFGVNDIVHIEYNGVKYGLKKVGGRSFTA